MFKVDGLDDFKDMLSRLNEEFPEEKKDELEAISTMAESEIKLVTPVGIDPSDSHKGLLRRSITHRVIDQDTSEVGPGEEAYYAQAVNDGHITRNGGFVKGQHYMEKGMQNAEPKIIDHIGNWLNNLMKSR